MLYPGPPISSPVLPHIHESFFSSCPDGFYGSKGRHHAAPQLSLSKSAAFDIALLLCFFSDAIDRVPTAQGTQGKCPKEIPCQGKHREFGLLKL